LLVVLALMGIGAGVVSAASFYVMSRSRQVDRNFGLNNIAQLVLAAVALDVMPEVSDRLGVAGMFAMLATLFTGSMLISKQLPIGGPTPSSKISIGPSTSVAWLALLSYILFFAAQGVVWPYLELIGRDGGLGGQEVANAVAASSIAALVGPVAVAMVGSRWGRLAPVSAACAMNLVAMWLLSSSLSARRFVVGACLFNAAWNLSSCYLPAVIARVDNSGRVLAWASFGGLGGIAAGPLAASRVVEYFSLGAVLPLGAVLCAASFVGLLPAMLKAREVT
jgi:hypothetical protein